MDSQRIMSSALPTPATPQPSHPLEALLGAGNSLTVASSERKIFAHYPKPHSAFWALQKGRESPLPGGGGPHPGALISLSVKGHADRAVGTAAEVRRGGGVQVSGRLAGGCLLPLSLQTCLPSVTLLPLTLPGALVSHPAFHTRTGPQLFTSHSWGRPRSTNSKGHSGFPAQPTRLFRGFLSHPPGAVPTPQLHNPTPRAKCHLQLFWTQRFFGL